MWCFLFFALLAASLMVIGHYERRVRTLEANPRERVRIVPRTLYDEQLGVDWVSES
jgi:uncharacterized membrane protein